MLALALKASIPLVSVRTGDPLSAAKVIKNLCPGLDTAIWNDNSASSFKQNDVLIVGEGLPKGWTYQRLYEAAEGEDTSVLFINLIESHPLIFDAGELPIPTSMVTSLLADAGVDEQHRTAVLHRLGGLTLKEIRDVCAITGVRNKALTPEAIEDTRRLVIRTSRGLRQVSTEVEFYDPETEVEEWLKLDGRIFTLPHVPQRLIPRGLMFTGTPGSGKGMAAKHIAKTLGVPLYLLELGSMLGKYVGDSEANMASALAQIDQMAPCVLLLDEVEKIFGTHDETGVTQRLLASLLWWLQEHRSRVLTIMTCNDDSKLPAELHRPGRIDRTISFKGLLPEKGRLFCMRLLHQLDAQHLVGKMSDQFSQRFPSGYPYPQAAYTAFIDNLLKLDLIHKEGNQ